MSDLEILFRSIRAGVDRFLDVSFWLMGTFWLWVLIAGIYISTHGS